MTKFELSLSIQYPDSRLKETLPRWRIRRWVQASLLMPAMITIRFVDAQEGLTLNSTYRGKDYATNVLTFPYDDINDFPPCCANDDIPTPFLDSETPLTKTACADIVLCTDVLLKEADAQQKTIIEHAAHLVVHGCLHAQGYDHIKDKEAEIMESMETQILAKLGFKDPYQIKD